MVIECGNGGQSVNDLADSGPILTIRLLRRGVKWGWKIDGRREKPKWEAEERRASNLDLNDLFRTFKPQKWDGMEMGKWSCLLSVKTDYIQKKSRIEKRGIQGVIGF